MINPKINISSNLFTLRKYHKWSQEEVADKVGVSRQAIAKWELGESVPDIIHCDALAKLYDVTLDDLLHYNEAEKKDADSSKRQTYFWYCNIRRTWSNSAAQKGT